MCIDLLTVLVVDDDRGWRELYAAWLAEHDVRTVTDGTETLTIVDDSIDIVLLDREMPGLSGLEVAERIATGEHDPHVVLSSSRPPDVEVADWPIDGYVEKSADEAHVRAVVDEYLAKQRLHAALDEYLAVVSKTAAIEATRPRGELDEEERYVELNERIARERRNLVDLLDAGAADPPAPLRDVERIEREAALRRRRQEV